MAPQEQIDGRRFRFAGISSRRRGGLACHALLSAGGSIPPQVRATLVAGAQRIARENLALTAETVRLQIAFDDAAIPALILKGDALAAACLRYSRSQTEQGYRPSGPPNFALRAFHLLESSGFQLSLPNRMRCSALAPWGNLTGAGRQR